MSVHAFFLVCSSVFPPSAVSGKLPSALSGEPRAKKARKAITIDMKLDVINRLQRGERVLDVGRLLGLPESTVRSIRDSAEKIKKSAQSGTPGSAKKTSYARSSIMEHMERMLSTWIEDQNQRNVPVSMFLAQAKARAIFAELRKEEEGPVKPFAASSGWFANFRRRYGYHNIRMSGEAASADAVGAERFVEALKAIIEEGGYSAKQIFNLDETALFWKRMPARTYISREEKTAPGFKASKDRYTLLFGGNAEGDCKLKPVLVYHSANPRALKGYAKNLLPVHFFSNPKGWVTGQIFSDYLVSKLKDELRHYCESENLSFKILLLVDNAPGHPTSIQDLCENIQIVYLPPNTTSLIQPMAQGVISTFKAYYLKKIFDAVAKASDNGKTTVKDFWKSFNIRDSIMLVGEAWDAVSHSCMNGVWKKLCPYLECDFKGFSVESDLSETREEIVSLAKKVGLAEVELGDVQELLDSHKEELSPQDLLDLEKEKERDKAENKEEVDVVRTLTAKRLTEAFRLIESALAILDEDDPNTERSSKVSRNVRWAMQCYKEILQEKQMKATQKASYFLRTSRDPKSGDNELSQPSTSVASLSHSQQPPSSSHLSST